MLRKRDDGANRDEVVVAAVSGLCKCLEAIRADASTTEAEKRRFVDMAMAKFAAKIGDDGDDETNVPADLVDAVIRAHGGKWTRLEATHWLLGTTLGREFARTHKQERPMNRLDELRSVAKRCGGVIEMCKGFVERNETDGISEHELVDLIRKHDPRPGETEAQTFTRHYTSNVELRKAIALAKSMPIVADPYDVRVSDQDNVEEAIKQLKELGRRQWPTASEAQQFARAFADPANAELARKAHVRPQLPENGFYGFPR
jgi:hypothetical protein